MNDDIRWKRNTPKSAVKAIIFLDLHRHFFQTVSTHRHTPLRATDPLVVDPRDKNRSFAPSSRSESPKALRNHRRLDEKNRFTSTGERLGSPSPFHRFHLLMRPQWPLLPHSHPHPYPYRSSLMIIAAVSPVKSLIGSKCSFISSTSKL